MRKAQAPIIAINTNTTTPHLTRVKILIIKGINLNLGLANNLEVKQRRRWSQAIFPVNSKWMQIGTARYKMSRNWCLRTLPWTQIWSKKKSFSKLMINGMDQTKTSRIKKTKQAADLQSLQFGSPTGVVHLSCTQMSKSFLIFVFVLTVVTVINGHYFRF